MTKNATPPSELVHYGIKGMKWGTRKSKQSLPMHRNYSRNNQAADRSTFGQHGVKRINKRMHKGQSYKKALAMEFVNQTAKATIGAGALAAGTILANNGGTLAQHVSKTAQRNRGRAEAAATMGLPRKPTNGPTYAKQKRNGVYKISTV